MLSRRLLLELAASVVSPTPTDDTEDDTAFGFGENAYGEGGYGGMAADCFIATAACGTESHDDVVALRSFRDDVLLQSRAGRRLVETYYRLSPPVARWIARTPRRRRAARAAIVRPARRLTAALPTTTDD